MTDLPTATFESPIGTVFIVTDGRSLCGLDFDQPGERLLRLLRRRFGAVNLAPAKDPLGAASRTRDYFAGRLAALDDLPLDGGGTPFQASVWKALRDIPCGTTTTYGSLAASLGKPAAMRAVGLANGANPIAIAVPCHRVIGSDGTLTGYGGGLWRKRWLLRHEGVSVDRET
jgi:methylated-DNA-[protein]-cysteine S-methyltransferase